MFSVCLCVHVYSGVYVYMQYFSPFSSVDLHRMASAFNTTISSLEDELTQLILDGQISARIDSNAKVAAVEYVYIARGQSVPVQFGVCVCSCTGDVCQASGSAKCHLPEGTGGWGGLSTQN